MGSRVAALVLALALAGCGIAVKGQVGKYQFDVNLIEVGVGAVEPAPAQGPK